MKSEITLYKKLKTRTFEIVQLSKDDDIASKVFDISLITLIIINIVIVIAETFTIPDKVQTVIKCVETISVIAFSVEYLIRLWTSDLLYSSLHPAAARIRYVFSFMAMIDLLSILPFYIPMILPVDLRVLRALRILRLFRLFKINRYTDALSTIGKVFKKKASELISSIFVVLLLMIISSVIMYNSDGSEEGQEDYHGFNILVDGSKVGSIEVIDHLDDDDNDAVYVERIDIDEDFRGQGIGTEVLTRVLKETCDYYYVIAAPDNKDAQRLYERLGEEYSTSRFDYGCEYNDQGYGVYVI